MDPSDAIIPMIPRFLISHAIHLLTNNFLGHQIILVFGSFINTKKILCSRGKTLHLLLGSQFCPEITEIGGRVSTDIKLF